MRFELYTPVSKSRSIMRKKSTKSRNQLTAKWTTIKKWFQKRRKRKKIEVSSDLKYSAIANKCQRRCCERTTNKGAYNSEWFIFWGRTDYGTFTGTKQDINEDFDCHAQELNNNFCHQVFYRSSKKWRHEILVLQLKYCRQKNPWTLPPLWVTSFLDDTNGMSFNERPLIDSINNK